MRQAVCGPAAVPGGVGAGGGGASTGIRITLGVLVLALLLGPAGAAAQTSGPASAGRCGVAAAAIVGAGLGLARYRLGDGLTGVAVGADVAGVLPAPIGDVELRGGYRAILLADGPDPHIVRIAGALPLGLPRLLGLAVCVTAHGGASWLSTDDGDLTIGVAGAGLRLVRPVAGSEVLPFVEVRGLAARNTGRLAGLEAAATAWSVGGAAGVGFPVRGLRVLLTASIDGLPAGLGLAPYPRAAASLSVGLPL